MKKLLIMTGVAAFAFGAFAAFTNGTGFDELNTGAFVPSTYWNNPAELEASVVAYENGEALAVRPAYFTGEGDNVNFLAIESASASTPLKRFVETTEDARAIGNGLYLDTLVQFTVSTETMGASEGSNAKLAIWAQTSDETPAVTNFVVQAGYITAGGVDSHNYTMTAPADFDYTAWHRLTVKAIANIDANATAESTHVVGFVVFVDGTALTRANSAAIGDEGYVPTLNTVAGKFAAAVLPSMIHTGNTKTTLQAVSFSGNGKIDDVSFTDVAPDFAKTDIVFTLKIGEGVTGFTLNGTPYANLTAGASVKLGLAANVTVVTVANVTYAAGYRDAVLSGGNGGTIGGLEFTVTGDAPEATISAVRDNFYVGGNGYATLAAAVAAVSGESNTIALNGNYTLTEADYSTDLGADTVLLTDSVVIDLDGHTLTSLSQSGDPLFYLVDEGEASLTIVNSGATDGVIDATGAVVYNGGNGQVIFGQKTDTNYVVVNGAIANIGNLLIVKGKFDVESNSDGDVCAIPPEAIPEGSTLAGQSVGGYWVVNAGGDEPVEDEVIAVPTAKTGLVYDGTEKTGVEAGTGYTLTGNTGTNAGEYTATAMLADGYVWADESKEDKSITWTIAKKTVTATITLAPASATYDAEKKTVDDYTDATVTFGGDTLANTDYTVTGLDTAVAEAGEFTITVAPAASGSNYTFDTVTAKLTVTAAVPPEPVKVEPGTTAESDTETAAKAVEFVAPAAVTEAGVDAEKYAALFEQKTSYNKTSGKWETTYELTAKAVTDLTTEVDADVKAITPTAAEATFTGTPGIYYHTVSGTSVNDLTGDNNWAMAGADGSVKLTLPKAGGTSGFYKIEASATK